MNISSKREQKHYYDFEDQIKAYKQICDELQENPTPWPVASNDAIMLDEILIHIKEEDLRQVHAAFAVRLIFRLLKKFDVKHVNIKDIYVRLNDENYLV